MFIPFVCPHCKQPTQLPLPAVRAGAVGAWVCGFCGRVFEFEVLMRHIRENGRSLDSSPKKESDDEWNPSTDTQ